MGFCVVPAEGEPSGPHSHIRLAREILAGKRRISADTGLRRSRALRHISRLAARG